MLSKYPLKVTGKGSTTQPKPSADRQPLPQTYQTRLSPCIHLGEVIDRRESEDPLRWFYLCDLHTYCCQQDSEGVPAVCAFCKDYVPGEPDSE